MAGWTNHLGLKVTSVVLAGVMWFAVSGARLLENEDGAADSENGELGPQHVAALERGGSTREWVLAGIPVTLVGGAHGTVHPATVTIRVRGAKADVDAAFPDIRAIADMTGTGGHDGVASVRVLAPASVRVVAVVPPEVHVGASDGEGTQ